MDAQVQEKDAFELPVISPWRRRPSREQVRFAMDLCRTELAYVDRIAAIDSFAGMDAREMSVLIDSLKGLRARRLARLRRTRPKR